MLNVVFIKQKKWRGSSINSGHYSHRAKPKNNVSRGRNSRSWTILHYPSRSYSHISLHAGPWRVDGWLISGLGGGRGEKRDISINAQTFSCGGDCFGATAAFFNRFPVKWRAYREAASMTRVWTESGSLQEQEKTRVAGVRVVLLVAYWYCHYQEISTAVTIDLIIKYPETE